MKRLGASRSVTVNIEELVLLGFPAVNGYRVGEAVQEELQRLFAERVIPSAFATSGEYPEIAGGQVRLPHRSSAAAIGGQIARSVYEAVRAADESRIQAEELKP